LGGKEGCSGGVVEDGRGGEEWALACEKMKPSWYFGNFTVKRTKNEQFIPEQFIPEQYNLFCQTPPS
jgi:hypothetical protein